MIDIGSGAWAALALGFLLGLKHATDADHVVAVATIAADRREGILRSVWIGASWGLGHTVPLPIVGAAVLTVPDRLLSPLEGVSAHLEFVVGVMLAVLGALALWNLARGRLHLHSHLHADRPHVHIHATHSHPSPTTGARPARGHGRRHGIREAVRPTFRPRSFAIGMVHGLAGSAAVMLALLPAIDSAAVGAGYLALFGAGTIISMSAITLAMSAPLAAASRLAPLRTAMVAAAGIASLAVGGLLMAGTASGSDLFLY